MVRRELAIAIVSAWCFACGSSRSGANGDATGAGATGGSAAGGQSTGGGAGAGGAGGGSGGAAGAGSGSGGTAGGGAASGGSAGSASGSAGAGAGAPGRCPGTTNHTPGTRLRPRFVVTSEGTRAWVGWHDTVLDMECDFNALADGSYRCVPNNWSLSGAYFTDAACTERAYTPGMQDPCTAMPYVMLHVSGGCDGTSGYEFYELGEPVAAAGGLAYSLSDDGVTCVATAVPPSESLYRRGAAVPSSTFVAATRVTEPGVGRIGTQVDAAEDGTRQLRGWTDHDHGDVRCLMRPTEGGTERCAPAGGRVNEWFSDAACSSNAVVWTNTCGDPLPIPYATIYPDSSCPGAPYQTRAVGAEFTGPLYSGDADSVCAMQPAAEGSRLFLTTPLPASDFQEITEWVDMTAPGRLKPRYHTTTDGGCWFNDFWDTELLAPCWFAQGEDGDYRCVPGEYVSASTLYLDAACTTAIGVWEPATCGLTEAPRFVLGSQSSATACVAPSVVAETEALTGPAYRLVAGTCTAVEDTTGIVRFREVDPSRLVVGTVMVE
jgi:hypothetical protein